MLANLMLTYKKGFGKHYINALGLAEVQRVTNTGFGTTVHGFSTDDFLYNNLQAGAVLKWGDNTDNIITRVWLLSWHVSTIHTQISILLQ